MLLLSLFLTAKETCSGERGREEEEKRDGEKGEGEREGGRRQRGGREREIVLSKEISCLQHMTHVVVQ